MNAIVSPPRADEFLTFMPGISDEEYQLRDKLRALRNAASVMIGNTDSNAARQLAWLASERATEVVYAPADHGVLTEVGRLCTRLMLTAMQVEKIDAGVWPS